MKKINLLPNIITAMGLAFGLFVIFRITVTDVERENFYHILLITAGLLLLSALCDVLDGAAARLLKSESEFGSMFDSLSDAVCFGVAPSVILLKSLSLDPGTELIFVFTIGTLVFSSCGVLRLVRFKVAKDDVKGDPASLYEYNRTFTGLPIPAAALAAVSANLFLLSPEFTVFFSISEELRATILIAIMILLGYLMISPWKFPSVKTIQFKVKSIHLVFMAVMISVLLLYGILHRFALAFFCFSWAYLLTALVLSTIRLIAGKKSKTLKDFEPEPDEID
ncbi:MAG: CDP-alcohol phosphatidyltransferase family protein [Chlamydiota bacterium]